MKKKKIKFGIIGLGHIGTRHADCIINHPDAQLVSVCDINSKDQWRKLNPNIIFSNSLEGLLKQDVDVINICTPNYLHASMAISVLNSKKDVVIEKPIALNTLDAEKITQVASSHNKIMFGVMQNRFSPTVLWLKNIIDANLLGDINMISVNCFWNRNENYYLNSTWHGSKLKDGGPLFTQFSHFIDIINWIFGDFSNISANFSSFQSKDYIEFEDSGIVNFHLKNKNNNTPIESVFMYSTALWNKNFESSITIIGKKGTIKIGGQYMDKIIYCDVKNYTVPQIKMQTECNDYGDYQGSASNHDKMIDHVIKVLLGSNNDNKTHNFSDGIGVVNIIERIYNLRN